MKWKPMERAVHIGPHPEPVIRATMEQYHCDRETAVAKLEAYDANCEIWMNDLYQVQVRPYDNHGLLHLNIRRRDGAHDIRDWRHFQRIKNDILGKESEAVELYPAESRLHDTSNKFHLWGYRSDFQFPVGFEGRDVRDSERGEIAGMRQRPLDKDVPERGNGKVNASPLTEKRSGEKPIEQISDRPQGERICGPLQGD